MIPPDDTLEADLRAFLRDKMRAVHLELRGLGDDAITPELMAAVGLYSSVSNHCYGAVWKFLHDRRHVAPTPAPVVDSPRHDD